MAESPPAVTADGLSIIDVVLVTPTTEFTTGPFTGLHGDLTSGTVRLRSAVSLRPTHSSA